jgi:uncharacterized membrane protein YccC
MTSKPEPDSPDRLPPEALDSPEARAAFRELLDRLERWQSEAASLLARTEDYEQELARARTELESARMLAVEERERVVRLQDELARLRERLEESQRPRLRDWRPPVREWRPRVRDWPPRLRDWFSGPRS